MNILVLNAGSSSQKSCLYRLAAPLPGSPPEPLWSAHIEWSETAGQMVVTAGAARVSIELAPGDLATAISKMLDTLLVGDTQVLDDLAEIDLIGHRVVHGGSKYSQPIAIDDNVKAAIAALSVLAPAHNPANLAGIEEIEQCLGDVPQIAVFDTAFHSQMPLPSAVYPIPYPLFEDGIRRYGFHGISHAYCSQRAAQLVGKPLEKLKLINCHLGNGCSLAAVDAGIGVDTTMGFTPLEGLMMGTRSGSIDPAILLHLMRTKGYDADRLDTLLNRESGLKGVSGISGDMREIGTAIANGNQRAQLAFDLYVHRLKSAIGAMVASLGGLDVLVFTAGVGEHSAMVRERVCRGLEFLGVTLDAALNSASPMDTVISAPDSAVTVLVIHTEEDWAIAKACWQLRQQLR
ncbi:MAG: acetate kinase [Cyanobacteria bacterium P01_G01_bin.4]